VPGSTGPSFDVIPSGLLRLTGKKGHWSTLFNLLVVCRMIHSVVFFRMRVASAQSNGEAREQKDRMSFDHMFWLSITLPL